MADSKVEKSEGKTYYAIDVAKFVCAMLVVTLHVVTYAFSNMAVDGAPPTGGDNMVITSLFPLYYIFARLAVPFFFITSAYFLFKKIKKNPDTRKEIVKKYCLRIFLLFIFWFIISIPVMIDKYIINSQINCGGGAALVLILKILFFGGFDGAWYLVASIISVLIVNAMAKYSLKANFALAIGFYIIACLFSTYYNIFEFLPSYGGFQIFKDGLRFVNQNFPIYLTFLNGVIFVLIGRLFAEREDLFSAKTNKILLCIMPFVMYGELFFAMYFSLNVATDCFFSLVIGAAALFQIIKNIQLKPRKIYTHMRKVSTFMYLFHFLFLYVFYRLVFAFNWTIFISNVPMTILIFFVTIALSIGLCELNVYLSKKKGLGFLKYSI